MIIERQTTYDCVPTLSDAAVLQFVKDGYISLPAAVPADGAGRPWAFTI
jgi:hypothetical protein